MAWSAEGRDWAAADSAAEGGARLRRAGGERAAQSQPRRHCSRAPNSGGAGHRGGGQGRARPTPARAHRRSVASRGRSQEKARPGPGRRAPRGRERRGVGPAASGSVWIVSYCSTLFLGSIPSPCGKNTSKRFAVE